MTLYVSVFNLITGIEILQGDFWVGVAGFVE